MGTLPIDDTREGRKIRDIFSREAVDGQVSHYFLTHKIVIHTITEMILHRSCLPLRLGKLPTLSHLEGKSTSADSLMTAVSAFFLCRAILEQRIKGWGVPSVDHRKLIALFAGKKVPKPPSAATSLHGLG
jgi:hypothetical protein